MKLVSLNNISFSYNNGLPIFKNCNLELLAEGRQGFVTAIMGASGSGKSTLLKLLLGIEKPQQGNITITPKDPVISYVPQEAILFEHLSTEMNAQYFKHAGPYKNRFNTTLYQELVSVLGLEDVLSSNRSVTEISGGQKQRLSLLRALSINPDFLLLDEPCNGLDADVKRSFLNKLRAIANKFGFYILYITHHKLEAQLIADEVVYLAPDMESNVITKPVKAPILEYIEKPPILEAATIFRFPDVKVLPVIKTGTKNVIIAADKREATYFLLVDETNVMITNNDGWAFELISRSPVYSVIKHNESNTEWMLPTNLVADYQINDIIYIKLTEKVLVYNKSGVLEAETL